MRCANISSTTEFLDKDANATRLHRSINHLTRVYIEPTNRCNLDCVTCIRNVWNEPLGMMSGSTLMHNYTSFFAEREHFRRRYAVGSLGELDLVRLWNEPEHVRFRERVKMFDFSLCASCGGCDLSENNETDCIGSPFPTCGNCLWAQGLVRCP